MPGEMDLSSALWVLGRNSHIEVWRKLLTYTIWPDDDRRRQSELAAFYATVVAIAEDLKINEKDEPTSMTYEKMQLDVEAVFRNEGRGWSSLIRPREYSHLPEIETTIMTAGLILGLIYSITKEHQHIKGFGTVNKAMHVIDATAHETGFPGRSKCFASWKSHKSVAHVSVGLMAVQQMQIQDERDALMTCLSIARNYQEFAASGEKPIIGRNEMWLVPASIELPKTEEVTFKLNPSLLAALQAYRARQ